MATKFNTVALAYFNSKNELVAWSSDSFGSPYKYPKTYQDTEEVRERLLNRVKDLNKVHENTKGFADFLEHHNTVASVLVRASNERNTKFFTENDVVCGKIVELDLVSDYSRDNYSPKWDEVVECVDNKKYSYK